MSDRQDGPERLTMKTKPLPPMPVFPTRCPARRVHPLTTDYYVVCAREAGHQGEHRTQDDFKWDDSSAYALLPLGAEPATRETL